MNITELQNLSTFPVISHCKEGFSINGKCFPVPSTMCHDPLVYNKFLFSVVPLVDDRKLLTPFILFKISHSKENLKNKTLRQFSILLSILTWNNQEYRDYVLLFSLNRIWICFVRIWQGMCKLWNQIGIRFLALCLIVMFASFFFTMCFFSGKTQHKVESKGGFPEKLWNQLHCRKTT